ncbi:hypothetical protein [Burkholderia gladioli]|uniref:hypothetical protein n=1 Tax=Burkholderia gladioli TaxID=28095 RepID=UPI003D1A4A1E
MSGDWIKMSADLSEDPIVITMSGRLGVDVFSVVGRLHRIWSWADRHLSDGLALGITPEWIDRYVMLDGFSMALIESGWLYRIDKDSVIDQQANLIDFFPETFIDSSRFLIDSRVGGGMGGVVFPRFFRFLGGKTTKTNTKTKTNPTPTREREDEIDKGRIDNETDKGSYRIDKGDAFQTFWKAYPRKDAKVQARKAFEKLSPDDDLQAQILDSLAKFKACDQWVREDGKYVPFASTWLNQRRWEDETTPTQPPRPPAASGYVQHNAATIAGLSGSYCHAPDDRTIDI